MKCLVYVDSSPFIVVPVIQKHLLVDVITYKKLNESVWIYMG